MDKGKIYMVTSKTSGKKYIGQAKNFSKNGKEWGVNNRWKWHLSEALRSKRDHCTILNNAIRKYGSEDFEIEILGEYLLTELDDWEIHFIKEHNALNPNGYNIRTGGKNGLHRGQKMDNKRKDKKHSQEAKHNIAKGQVGNRRGVKKRKIPEDNSLPKYISAIRRSSIVIGYVVDKFPIGIETAKYTSAKNFGQNSISLEENLKRAKQYVAELEEKYKNLHKQIKKSHQEDEKKFIQKKLDEKKEKRIKTLPEHIVPVYEGNRLIGYAVEGFKDSNEEIVPRKEYTNGLPRRTLEYAKKYLAKLERLDGKNEKKIKTLPEAIVPEFIAEFTVPEFTAPEFTVPEFTAPEFTAPEFTVPEFTVPEFTVPEFIVPLYAGNRLKGYAVEGFIDADGKIVPRKEYTIGFPITTLEDAKRYLAKLKETQQKNFKPKAVNPKDIYIDGKNRTDPLDKNLPKYISSVKVKGEKIGYQINNFPIRDKDGKVTRKEKKKFCSKQKTMEEKYQEALKYLEELKKDANYLDNDQIKQLVIKQNDRQLPEFIFSIYKDGKRIGYYVKYKDFPKREFIKYKNLHRNIVLAKKYLKKIQIEDQKNNCS